MNTRTKKYDDLTVINGIGPARQEWLRNKLGIHTYHNLAALLPEEILAQLKLDGLIASHGEVEKWVAKAAQLAAAEPSCIPGDWAPFASFVVEFQVRDTDDGKEEYCTAIQHMESDVEQKWHGIETGFLCQWMRERVGTRVAEPKLTNQPFVRSEPLPVFQRLTIAMRQVDVFQPPTAVQPAATCPAGQPFQGFIQSDEPFALRVSFSIMGLEGVDLHNRNIPGYAQFYARALPFGELFHLGDSEPFYLATGAVEHSAGLPAITFPKGMFAFKVLTRLSLTPPILAYLESPLLQVY